MKRLGLTPLAIATVGLLLSGAAQAELHDRGGGLLYDDVLNVTWLGDANYAKTSNYDADGRMTWNAAKTWATNLSYYDSVRKVTYDDWRLASNTPVGADWNYRNSNAGTTDAGYNITSPHSELSYMYYVNLGFKGYYSPTGMRQPDFGIFGNGLTGGERDDLGPNGVIDNLQPWVYWSGAAYKEPGDPASYASGFNAGYGYQGYWGQNNEFHAWAVRPGDVAAVPEPEAYTLLLAGLGLLGGVAKRQRRSLGAS